MSNMPMPMVENLYQSIVTESQAEAGDMEIDGQRLSARTVIDNYLNLPLSKHGEGTYTFWKEYTKTTDKAQKGLAHLARLYLTPPPTSTSKLLLANSVQTKGVFHRNFRPDIRCDMKLHIRPIIMLNFLSHVDSLSQLP